MFRVCYAQPSSEANLHVNEFAVLQVVVEVIAVVVDLEAAVAVEEGASTEIRALLTTLKVCTLWEKMSCEFPG